MRTLPFAVVVALAIGAGACGTAASSPAAPSSTPEPASSTWTGPAIAGNWSGPWTYAVSGLKVTDDVRAVFAASGATMTGLFTGAAGVSGTFSLSQPSPLGGTVSLTVVLLSGSVCIGSGTLSGSFNGDELRFQVPVVTSVSGGCSVWASDNTFVLRRS